MTLLAAQTDFSEPGELGLFIDASELAALDALMWRQGYLDGSQVAAAFQLLNTRDLIWSRMMSEYLLGCRSKPNDLMAWNADATRMPYRMHIEYLTGLQLNNALAEGRYCVDGKPVALSDIEEPARLRRTHAASRWLVVADLGRVAARALERRYRRASNPHSACRRAGYVRDAALKHKGCPRSKSMPVCRRFVN
jgi:hypothetical protein